MEQVATNAVCSIFLVYTSFFFKKDCRRSSVPAAIVPAQITKYVNDNYPDAKILQIERDKVDYELQLSNRLELTFDKKCNIIDIDN